MNYSKLSDDVLRKKINSYNNEINNMKYTLDRPQGENTPCQETDRALLEEMCTSLANTAKAMKAEVKVYEDAKAEARRIEEEQEREKRRQEKEAKEKEIRDNSIHDTKLFDRIKFRFFNLTVPDSEDPEELNPVSSGPFFEDKDSQFKAELHERNFRLFTVTYINKDMHDKETFMQSNLNQGFASQVEEDYSHFFFVCFRVKVEDGKCIYRSYWISNYAHLPSVLFPDFEFVECTDKDEFASLFKKSTDDNIISQIYVR